MDQPPNPWKRLDRSENKFFDFLTLIEDQVVFPDGKEGKYYFFTMKPCAVLIPEVEPGKLLLVGQWRYPTGQFSWEFPMGGVLSERSAAEDYQEDAVRECFEETGYRAESPNYLGSFYGSNANNDQLCHIFYSNNLRKEDGATVDESEIQQLKIFAIEDLVQMVLRSEIRDAFTIVSLFHYLQRKETL